MATKHDGTTLWRVGIVISECANGKDVKKAEILLQVILPQAKNML